MTQWHSAAHEATLAAEAVSLPTGVMAFVMNCLFWFVHDTTCLRNICSTWFVFAVVCCVTELGTDENVACAACTGHSGIDQCAKTAAIDVSCVCVQ